MRGLTIDLWEVVGGMVLFGGIAALMGADLWTDFSSGVRTAHLAWEAGVMGLALLGLAYLAHRLLHLRRQVMELTHTLDTTRADLERWRSEASDVLRGLAVAVDRQFERWGLTAAERDVGFLLLKGLSYKEIAGQRRVSVRTVRQQAHALYYKADLPGRPELTAFFLDDLLLPPEHLSDKG